MGEVISLLDKLKLKQLDHESKMTEFVRKAKECETLGMEEYKLEYTRLGLRELNEANRLKKQILELESPSVKILSLRICTAPLEKPSPVDFTPTSITKIQA